MTERWRVGAYTFSVHRKPPASLARRAADIGLRVAEDETVHGLTDPTALRVYLAEGLHPQRLRVVLAHELLHAIWWERRLPDVAPEEEVVEALSTGLIAALIDNPRIKL